MAGKGSRNRVQDRKAWDDCPLWDNIEREKLLETNPTLRAMSGEYLPQDWPEDSEHENGNYTNQCWCGKTFVGNKRRFDCKLCDAENRERWEAMSEEEQVEHMRKVGRALWDGREAEKKDPNHAHTEMCPAAQRRDGVCDCTGGQWIYDG